jgi:hypothetical protein
LDGIDTRLDGIDTRLDGIDTRLSNSSAYGPQDTIISPKMGEVEPSIEFAVLIPSKRMMILSKPI